MALVQTTMIIYKAKNKKGQSKEQQTGEGSEAADGMKSDQETTRTLGFGFVAYLVIALILAVIGGLLTQMSFGMFIWFLLFAALAAYLHELIVGIAAMHSDGFRRSPSL